MQSLLFCLLDMKMLTARGNSLWPNVTFTHGNPPVYNTRDVSLPLFVDVEENANLQNHDSGNVVDTLLDQSTLRAAAVHIAKERNRAFAWTTPEIPSLSDYLRLYF